EVLDFIGHDEPFNCGQRIADRGVFTRGFWIEASPFSIQSARRDTQRKKRPMGRNGLRHRRSPELGRRFLHVEEDRARRAPRRKLALALLGGFASLFAVLAANCEWKSTKPL